MSSKPVWASDMVTWYWSANTLFWQLSIDHNMDFQYHACTIEPRLHDLALGWVWRPSSSELALLGARAHDPRHQPPWPWKKSCMVFYFFACMWLFLWSWGSDLWQPTELCLKTITFLHHSKAFRSKLKIFEVHFVPKPLYQIELIEVVINLETNSFEMKWPLMGTCKSPLELQVNAFYSTLICW